MPGRLHDPDYALVVEHLAAARKRLGVTQVELAGRLARPQSYVSKIERLERRLDVGEWLRIVSVLGLDPAEQFGELAVRLSVVERSAPQHPPAVQGSSLAGKTTARAPRGSSKL